MKKLLIIYVCALSLLLWSFARKENISNSLNVFYTGEASGELEPCGCTGMKTGGVAQRSGWINYLNKDKKWLLIDGGFASKKNDRQQQIKFETYHKMIKAMNYHFSSITQKEVDSGREEAKPYIGRFRDKLFVVLRYETDKDLQRAKSFLKDNNVDLVFVMAKGKTSAQVHTNFPEGKYWRIFLVNDADNPITPLTPKEKTIVLSAGDRGRYAGVLKINWENGKFKWQREHIAISSEYPPQKEVVKILEKYKKQVKQSHLIDFVVKRSSPIGYVGTDMCMSCHTKEYREWISKQDHAHAFATLQKQNYHHDPECVKCHVVGYEFAEGYRNFEESDYLINVGCENCHGPGAEHAFNPKPGYGRTNGEDTCISCHDKDHSPHFAYGEYMKKIRHWREK
ncbi:multiheme c-type cytochrome [Candidatus Uabimicrobium sp. HlEnr_7]|uniref:multiheme c-type cytochrome n=1 Tax=Candidatus Uabimicrobium helgolandensis TaxID=3095367 RepID=UPI0035562AB0